MKTNLLSRLKLKYFSNLFGMTVQFDVNITLILCSTSIFSSDITMISYFKITFDKRIITNPTFFRAFKFLSFFLVI